MWLTWVGLHFLGKMLFLNVEAGGTYSKTRTLKHLRADESNPVACRTNKLLFCLFKLSKLNTLLLYIRLISALCPVISVAYVLACTVHDSNL